MKLSLKLNSYNVFGIILLLPFFTVFVVDLVARIAQGDLVHYNRPLYNFLSHTPLYQTPVLFLWVIVFPLLAAAINLISIIRQVGKKDIFTIKFVEKNFVSIALLIIGLFFVAIIKLHDFAPCMVKGFFIKGVGDFSRILQYCSKA